MMYVLLGCQLILAPLMCLAAASKLLYPQDFVKTIQNSVVPKMLIYPIALLIIITELELALGLAFSNAWSLPTAFVGAFFLLSLFTLWLVVVYRQKLSTKCGCFGATNATMNKQSIIRNIILMGLALLGFFSARLSSFRILPPPSLWTLVVGIVLAGCATSLLLTRRSVASESNNNQSTFTAA